MQDDKITILVIDDSADVLEIETIALGEFGYNVIPCTRADEALAIVAGNTPLDMVLTDVVLTGDIDGWHLADRIRAMRPNIKVAFTSGYVQPTTLSVLRARGAFFLPKPWRADALENFLRCASAIRRRAESPAPCVREFRL
jgi:DNA-binding NtrC family response regulator